MSFLFGKGKGKSSDIVKSIKDALNAINKEKVKIEKVCKSLYLPLNIKRRKSSKYLIYFTPLFINEE